MSAPIVIIRHPNQNPEFYSLVMEWIDAKIPSVRKCFELQYLPGRISDWSTCRLVVMWLQDPVQLWSIEAYLQAEALAGSCEVRGIPVINRVRYLENAARDVSSRLMSTCGFRTPKSVRISDTRLFRETLLGVPLPLMIRNVWGHGPPMLRVDTMEDVQNVEVEKMLRPVAIEIIDVSDPRDGLYRKYRYIAAGTEGVSHHLQVSAEWITRGENRVISEATRNEELSYVVGPDPHHESFQEAMRNLNLDFAAFDYGYDRDGSPVVWEVNPYPYIRMSTHSLAYRNQAIHFTLAAMVRLYLRTANIEIPRELAIMRLRGSE